MPNPLQEPCASGLFDPNQACRRYGTDSGATLPLFIMLPGVRPVTRRNTATKALGVSYPTRLLTTETGTPAAKYVNAARTRT